MRYLTFIVFILSTLPFNNLVNGQSLRGKVIDKSTNAPLEFVHIGIIGKNSGSISKESGDFELELSQFIDSDTILISHIGYKTLQLTAGDISTNSDISLALEPINFEIPEIVIIGNDVESYTLGREKTTKITTGHSGASSYGVGKEWGLLIKYENVPYYIKDVSFHTRFNTVDSVLFRINVYELNDFQFPGRSMLNKPIYTKSYKRDKWISSSIIAHNILVEKDIVVTFETIRIWYKKKGKNQLFFTHGEGYEEGTTYSRESSHSKWLINQSGPIAMYVKCVKKE